MALDVSVVTPEKVVWQGEAKFLIARAAGGDIGVLPGHAPFLAALHDARLIIEAEDGQTYAAVHGGFIEVFDDHVTVLTLVAELAEEIDLEAERRLAEEDTPENRAALLRAASRIQTAAEAGILDIG
jgi:F-type H+-transporting ATPase subunit epsilon